ncbi:MAG: DUF2235 domain-containing protein [Myxococcales bacterium]|nr:DUF2235 domain-containing protein [Myxococcales bacterium]
MPKNIVIFSDGTGQDGGFGYNTNIYKLFNMVEDRSARQVAFYDAGLGTGFQRVSGSIGGAGISRNIRQCYEFIFRNYETGDRIFLFGFSRGAATVRSLSSFIHYFGILPQSRPELIRRAYCIYKTSRGDKRKREADEFVHRHHTIWARVTFLGCFDTVAALGLPNKSASAILDGIPGFRHKFHNFRLSESVENAYHALALDDERKAFLPVLWDSEHLPYQRVRQVWFAGMHTDVGGGYKEQELSDIPLVWMASMAVRHGLWIYPRHQVEIAENANGTMHDSRGTWLTKLYRRKVRGWDQRRQDPLVVHQSVIDRMNSNANNYMPWIGTRALSYEIEPWRRHEDHEWYRRPG